VVFCESLHTVTLMNIDKNVQQMLG